MSVLERLEQVKPYNGFTKLALGYHLIERFRAVNNSFASKEGDPQQTVMVELKDEVVFLPRYWSIRACEVGVDKLNELIEADEKLFLYFGGKYENTK